MMRPWSRRHNGRLFVVDYPKELFDIYRFLRWDRMVSRRRAFRTAVRCWRMDANV